jgi:hypothetical protein
VPEHDLSGQIGGLGDRRRAGQDRVDVVTLMIFKIIQLGREVRRGAPQADGTRGRDGGRRKLDHPTLIGSPSPN